MPWANGEAALENNQCGFTQSPVRQPPQRFFKKTSLCLTLFPYCYAGFVSTAVLR